MTYLKTRFVSFVFFMFLAFNVFSATPFDAPAEFNLEGSSISFDLTFQTKLGSVNAALNPNPSPVTGKIVIDSLNKSSGAFYGKFKDISASTTISGVAGLGSIPTTVTINSPISGMFLWDQNKVVINAENLVATITMGSQQFPVTLRGTVIPATYNNGVISINFDIDYSDNYNNFAFSILASVSLTGNLQQLVAANPWIELLTSKASYKTGEYFDMYVSLGNSGAEKNVDIYLGVLSPNGELLILQPDFTFSTNIAPVLSNFTMPPGTMLSSAQIFHASLPSTLPPINSPGMYTLLAGFTNPGTLDFIGDIASSSFEYEVSSQDSSGTFDGLYIGSANNSTSQSECSGINLVTFNISNNLIEGEAEQQQGQETDGYPLTGVVTQDGSIVNGIIWEEYMNSLIAIGVFDGNISGGTVTGTWSDSYGCYGTYTLTKQPNY